MPKLIALDNGHGLNTGGKRTPPFTDGTKSGYTGKTFMHEWEFNRAVVQLLKVELERCGFRTLEVSPTEDDTSITTRCNRAKSAKADFFLSVHANALHDYWGNPPPRGIETLTDPSGESLRIGKILQAELVVATGLTDRGMKDGAWLGVVKGTRSAMPSALVECGFMDNPAEAKMLLSDAYRELCAMALAKGLCKAFGIPYVIKEDEQPMTAAEQKAFVALEKKVEELTSAVTVLTMAVKDATKLINAPKFFVEEFGSADLGGLIDTPQMTYEGWRSTAIGLRVQGFGKGKK